MKNKKYLAYLIACILLLTTFLFPFSQNVVQANSSETIFDNYEKSEVSIKAATVFYEKFDFVTRTVIKKPIQNISVEKAYEIRDILVDLQNQYSSTKDRIAAQIDVLYNYGLIPAEVSLDSFTKKLPVLTSFTGVSKQVPTQSGVTPNVIICGPTITSFLTIGGPLLPLHMLLFGILPPFWYNSSHHEFDAFTGTKVATFIGLMPIVAFYCTATTLINAFGAVIGEHTVISPFIAMMILHAGFGISVCVFDDEFPVNIFDWSLGLSVTGLIAYIQIL